MAQTIFISDGASHIGSYCVLQALRNNYHVRTSVRSSRREAEVEQILREKILSREKRDRVEFYQTNDLSTLEDYREVLQGFKVVVWIVGYGEWRMSEMGDGDFISLARDPVLRVLEAAKGVGGVERVVVVNSFAAISGCEKTRLGKVDGRILYTEEDWSEGKEGMVQGGSRRMRMVASVAERAWWEFMKKEYPYADEKKSLGGMQLVVINPVSALGPILHASQGESVSMIRNMLQGKMNVGEGVPNLGFGIIDVRDLTNLVFAACTSQAISGLGERFIASGDEGDCIFIKDAADILKRGLRGGKLGGDPVKVKTFSKWTVMLVFFDADMNGQLPKDWDKAKRAVNLKARGMLGWEPRWKREEVLVETARSLIENGVVEL